MRKLGEWQLRNLLDLPNMYSYKKESNADEKSGTSNQEMCNKMENQAL